MTDDLHLHIRDHMDDCIRSILGAVADELNDRANVFQQGKVKEALNTAAQDIEHMAKQFK